MKHILRHIGVIVLVSWGVAACEKEGIQEYDRERAALEFGNSSGTYSFKLAAKNLDTIEIAFNVEGRPVDYRRSANIIVIADSTTATAKEYKIVGATVEPDAWQGTLKVEVQNTAGDNFDEVRVYFGIGNNEDFIPGVAEQQHYMLTINNKLIRPSGWAERGILEKYYLGNYSTSYYEFIIAATGETNFPYPDPISGYNDGKVWQDAELNAFLELVKHELKLRNERVGTPLLHSDGIAQGQEVVVGKYYK